ncbi:hypothetical protein SNEBB_004137 [Seison nebaliae]|nr:hypothetical protein SNEBB_004137 [Seison nebaliae]
MNLSTNPNGDIPFPNTKKHNLWKRKRSLRYKLRLLQLTSPISHSQLKKVKNTYQLAPLIRPKVETISSILSQLILKYFPNYNMKYMEWMNENHSHQFVDDMRERLKSLSIERYKYLINLVVVERQGQHIDLASNALIRTNTDSFLTYKKEGQNLVILLQIIASYQE